MARKLERLGIKMHDDGGTKITRDGVATSRRKDAIHMEKWREIF